MKDMRVMSFDKKLLKYFELDLHDTNRCQNLRPVKNLTWPNDWTVGS